MKWDKISTKKVVLSEENSCATSNSSAWTSVLASEQLSGGIFEVVIDTVCVDNPSLFIGVATSKYWDAVEASAAEDEEMLPRDSPECICMHGDGRCFIKTQEKDWGLMKLASDASLVIVLDFPQGIVSFKLARTVRGKVKETVAEIPGLFDSATIVACFGGRDQQCVAAACVILEPQLSATARAAQHIRVRIAHGRLVLSSCERRAADDASDTHVKKARDNFEGLGEEKLERLQLEGNTVGGTYAEQLAAVAAMSEGSM